MRSGDLALPQLARAVPVDLDPVLVRIAQVQRLADEMIREPDQGHRSRTAWASQRARSSVKGPNLRRDARITLVVEDDEPPFALVHVRGRVIVEADVAGY